MNQLSARRERDPVFFVRRRPDRRVDFRDRRPFADGTFPPARRASDRPIAIACFRLVTRFPDRPLRSVPRFRSRIARLTFRDAVLPYLAMVTS